MPHTIDATAWSATLLGLVALSAGIGALRVRDLWRRTVDEVAASPALQLLGGLVELVIAVPVYLANPWLPGDIMACIMKSLGGLMIVEALVVIAFADLYIHFWLRNLSRFYRGAAIITLAAGLALTAAGFARFA